MHARTVSSPPKSKTPGLSSELTLLFCSKTCLPTDKKPGKTWQFRLYTSSVGEQRLAAGEVLGDQEGHGHVLIRTGKELKQSQLSIVSKFNPGEIFPVAKMTAGWQAGAGQGRGRQ